MQCRVTARDNGIPLSVVDLRAARLGRAVMQGINDDGYSKTVV